MKLQRLRRSVQAEWAIRKLLYKSTGTRLFVLSGMPKSATAYLRLAIERASGERVRFADPKFASGYGHNFYDRRKIPWLPGSGRVIRLYGHTPLSMHNYAIMEAIDPDFIAIVLIRPLPDIVVSYADHIARAGMGPIDTRVMESIEGYRNYGSLSSEEKCQFIIDFVGPWFWRYIMTWLNWRDTDRRLVLRYDDIARDISSCILRIDRFAAGNGIHLRLKSTVEDDLKYDRNSHFNVGVSGRGASHLTGKQLEQLQNQARFVKDYPGGPEIYKYLLEGCG